MPKFIEGRSRDTLSVNGSLESLLPATSDARLIWQTLADFDFSPFDARYRNDEVGPITSSHGFWKVPQAGIQRSCFQGSERTRRGPVHCPAINKPTGREPWYSKGLAVLHCQPRGGS